MFTRREGSRGWPTGDAAACREQPAGEAAAACRSLWPFPAAAQCATECATERVPPCRQRRSVRPMGRPSRFGASGALHRSMGRAFRRWRLGARPFNSRRCHLSESPIGQGAPTWPSAPSTAGASFAAPRSFDLSIDGAGACRSDWPALRPLTSVPAHQGPGACYHHWPGARRSDRVVPASAPRACAPAAVLPLRRVGTALRACLPLQREH